MKFKQLRHIVDELHRGYPEIDDAEVKINIGHSVVGFDEISHFIKEDGSSLPHKREANRAVEIKPRASLFASRVTPDHGPTRSQLL